MENFFVLGQKSRNGYKPIRPYAHVKSCKYTKNETWERHDVLIGKDKSMELEMLAMLTEFSFENPAGTGTEYCIMFKAPSDGNLAIINKQGVNLLIFIPFERNAKNSLLSVDFSFNESSKKNIPTGNAIIIGKFNANTPTARNNSLDSALVNFIVLEVLINILMRGRRSNEDITGVGKLFTPDDYNKLNESNDKDSKAFEICSQKLNDPKFKEKLNLPTSKEPIILHCNRFCAKV